MLMALDRIAVLCILVCPVFLLHGRAVADVLMVLTSLCFLARSAITRDWAWLRTGWVIVAAVWWLWLLACSVRGGLMQAVVAVRFLVFVAAAEHWVLRIPWRRAWLARITAIAALYIALQSLLQVVTGRNLQGYRRWGDGEITGPFEHPRAGAPFSRLLFPAVLPAMAWMNRWAGRALLVASVLVVVLIGQRMPLLLTGLGLFVTALLLPRLRAGVLAACVGAVLLVAASAVVVPPTFYRLVDKFSNQMEHFPDSPYGLIAMRAAAMIEAHPVTGLGFDGFRRDCAEPEYFRGWRGGDGGGANVCVQHPHNHYLQAAVESGFPGLILFCALVLAWLRPLAAGLWRDPAPLRVGLFVAALVQEWPIASSSDLLSMPLSGWFFLLLGLGLAESRAYMTARTVRGV
ncbi:O-antigen ligase [Acidisphaera sp. L21]|uniref:O-antigen ligase family protein n=1 Tax=Acidisphaera sp. L21 TaxID=1641851 RepID=UPI00131E4FC5|nr:O-antigen ligase family protein [Acidisphaera sp. L21]